jgi:hypothetical protein
VTPIRRNDKEAKWKERGRVTCVQRLVQHGTSRIGFAHPPQDHTTNPIRPSSESAAHANQIRPLSDWSDKRESDAPKTRLV